MYTEYEKSLLIKNILRRMVLLQESIELDRVDTAIREGANKRINNLVYFCNTGTFPEEPKGYIILQRKRQDNA